MITKKPIQLREIEGMDGKYEVVENIEYYNGLVVPKSFITDLASIPKLFQGVVGVPEDFDEESILHDFLYSKYNNYGINRDTADKIFRQSLVLNEVNPIVANLMYLAVKVGGELHWQEKIFTEQPYEKQACIDHTKEHKEYQERMNELLKEWYVE